MNDFMTKKSYDLTEITRLLLEMRENCIPKTGDAYEDPNRTEKYDALNAAIDLINNPSMISRWISVQDRLPESQKPVLVCAKDKTFGHKRVLKAAHIGYHECSTDDYEWQDYEGDTEYDEEKDCFWIPECWYETNAVEDNGNWMLYDDYEITHWMPLPEPPKEEEE